MLLNIEYMSMNMYLEYIVYVLKIYWILTHNNILFSKNYAEDYITSLSSLLDFYCIPYLNIHSSNMYIYTYKYVQVWNICTYKYV